VSVLPLSTRIIFADNRLLILAPPVILSAAVSVLCVLSSSLLAAKLALVKVPDIAILGTFKVLVEGLYLKSLS